MGKLPFLDFTTYKQLHTIEVSFEERIWSWDIAEMTINVYEQIVTPVFAKKVIPL